MCVLHVHVTSPVLCVCVCACVRVCVCVCVSIQYITCVITSRSCALRVRVAAMLLPPGVVGSFLYASSSSCCLACIRVHVYGCGGGEG